MGPINPERAHKRETNDKTAAKDGKRAQEKRASKTIDNERPAGGRRRRSSAVNTTATCSTYEEVSQYASPLPAKPKEARRPLSPRSAFVLQLRNEVMSPPPVRRCTFQVDYEPGQFLGLTLSRDLVVLEVDQRPGTTPLWDKIKVHDIVRAIGTTRVTTLAHFHQLLKFAQGPLTLGVDRISRVAEMGPSRLKYHNADASRDVYLTVYLLYRRNAKSGLNVVKFEDICVVNKVEEGMAYGGLEVGDVILDVNGGKPNSTDDVKKAMWSALKSKQGFVSFGVARPMSCKSLGIVRPIFDCTDEDPWMKMDATLIGRMECTRRKVFPQLPPSRKILHKRRRAPEQRTLSFNEHLTKTEDIESDVDESLWEDLQPVPARLEEPEDPTPKGQKLKSRFRLLLDKFHL